MNSNELSRRIEKRNYTVGVIGLGYIGLPLLSRFGEAGFPGVGYDVNESKIQRLRDGSVSDMHPEAPRVQGLFAEGQTALTTDPDDLREADAMLICVPTPLDQHREPDLRHLRDATTVAAEQANEGDLIVLESTTYPGTTEEEVRPKLENQGYSIGSDIYLCYSPEREDPGGARRDFNSIPKVIGGSSRSCVNVGRELYSKIVDEVVTTSSTQVAEASKMLENVYRGVNIALVNELKVVFDRMGVDIWEVIEAAETKPFGFQPFYPGPGIGGHCIPVDPFYLAWKAKELDLPTRFVELAGEINTRMPRFVVSQIQDALNEHSKPLNGSDVRVLGVAYKPEISDTRESPAIPLIRQLLERGANPTYSDPHVPEFEVPGVGEMQSREVNRSELEESDICVIVTDHSDFSYKLVADAAPLVLDTRNAMRSRGLNGPNVRQA